MCRGHWFVVALSLLAFGATVSWAAETQEARPVPRPAAARKEGNIIRVNTRPTVLTWAPGLTDVADLDTYAAAGLNTLAVPITSASDEALSQAFTLATAGEEHGLLIVGALSPEELKNADGEALPVDPLSEQYVSAVHDFVEAAAQRMNSHPRLIGWVVEAVPPDAVVWNDEGFQAFLKLAYRDIAAVNGSWGTEFDDYTDITTEGIADIDSARPGGVGRARLDLAEYRRKTYADTMSIWAKAVLRASPDKLILAGDLTDYRSMISLDPDFDGLVAGTIPSVAETDMETSNIQGVDIARRANQFAALQTLDLTGGPKEDAVGNWINLALLHGACGIVYSNWQALSSSESLRAAVKQAADAIRQTGWFPYTPVASAAILYEPFAGGAMRSGRSLYGYLDGVTAGEPSNLFQSFQNGSRYGLMDVLSSNSLGAVDLNQYRVLIVPAAFDLPEEAQLALNQFALRGGALIVDAGAGMYQAGGTIDSLPDILRDTLGLRRTETEETPSEPESETSTPGLPIGTAPGGTLAVPVKPAQGLSSNQTLAALAEYIDELLQGPEASRYLGSSFGGPDSPGLRVHGLGKGFTVYAPAFLYQQWDPTSDSFAEFHDRVLSWGHDVMVVSSDNLWPPVAVSSYAEGGRIGVAAPTGEAAAVDLTFAPNELYLVPDGAERVANPGDDDRIELLFPGAPLSVAGPLPITVTPLESGMMAVVAVNEYGPDRIELSVAGNGSEANPSRGVIVVSGGEPTQIEIALRDGRYPIRPGSMHHVIWREGRRVVSDTVMMPDTETGAIVIQGSFTNAQLEITPSSETAPTPNEESGNEATQ